MANFGFYLHFTKCKLDFCRENFIWHSWSRQTTILFILQLQVATKQLDRVVGVYIFFSLSSCIHSFVRWFVHHLFASFMRLHTSNTCTTNRAQHFNANIKPRLTNLVLQTLWSTFWKCILSVTSYALGSYFQIIWDDHVCLVVLINFAKQAIYSQFCCPRLSLLCSHSRFYLKKKHLFYLSISLAHSNFKPSKL